MAAIRQKLVYKVNRIAKEPVQFNSPIITEWKNYGFFEADRPNIFKVSLADGPPLYNFPGGGIQRHRLVSMDLIQLL